MGTAISTVRSEITKASDDQRQRMEERLLILERMVQSRLENAHTKILKGTRDDQELHSGSVVQYQQRINIKLEDTAEDSVGEVIKSFFSGYFLQGLQKIVEVGANAILGNESMGEHESTDMFIVWSSNALLRCDAYYYRWNFSSKGVIDRVEGVVGIVLMKRVIDVSVTDPQVVAWAITEMAARQDDHKSAKEMIEQAMEVLKKVAAYQVELKGIKESDYHNHSLVKSSKAEGE